MKLGQWALGGLAGLALGLIAASGVGFWQWEQARDVTLSQAPTLAAAAYRPSPSVSEIALRLRIPFSSLQQAIGQALPLQFDLAGTGRKACVKLPLHQKICGTPEYHATVAREGPVQISGSGDQFRVSMPIGITGQGGVDGDAARLLGLQAKKFHAALMVNFNAKLDLDQDWCPVLQGAAGYRWIDPPRVEVVGGVWMDVSQEVNTPLQAAIAKAAGNLPRAISCERVRGPVARVWHEYDIPLRMAGLYVRILPTAMGFSGLQADGGAIDLAARITAQTSLLTSPAVSDVGGDVGAFPALARIPDDPGEISLLVPIHAPYGLLGDAAMRALGPREFEADRARIRISSVAFYPSGDRVVARIGFTARAPRRWFDTSGVVFVAGVPAVSADGRMLRLTDVGFSRILDNQLWSGLSVLFEGQIKDALTAAAVLDLGDVEANAGAAVKAALADPKRTGGIVLDVGTPVVRLASVAVGKNELIGVAQLQASLAGELDDIVVPKLRVGAK